ncbi:MAG: Hsp70 family protein [Chloroflexi bacterium]|nr:Hsp70 family protein [Chloroflexota bacterium]
MQAIGIDFGTTNCSASVYRDGRIEFIPLEGERSILPSTICITQNHEVTFGRAAIQRYLTLTRETPIRYQFTDLREFTSVFEEEVESREFIESDHGLVVVSSAGGEQDLETPARLFQSLKTGLRDPNFHGTTVYEQYYAIEELIGLILRHIRERAEAYLGEPVNSAVIGRPVSYAPSERPPSLTVEQIDETAHERMLAAARIAGFEYAALEFEPVAATRHLQRDLESGSRALVFDFGGGTLDLALSQVAGTTPEIIATYGMPLGGDDFDSAIMEHSLLKHFGQGTTLGPKELDFPENLLAPLLHWQTIPLLATPASMAHIAAIKRQSNAPQTVTNLQILVRQGLGFQLFQHIEAAKIALSDHSSAQISLHEKGLDIEERITRTAFVSAISDHLVQIERALLTVLDQARLAPEQVDTVLMTGGSSLVPAVQGTVRRVFGADKVRAADPFMSIVAGLGIIAAQDDICVPVAGIVSSATEARLKAEAVTIGERVAFQRGQRTVEGLVVRRAGGRLHDATLVIEFWDDEMQQFVSTMRHETKVTRLKETPTDHAPTE